MTDFKQNGGFSFGFAVHGMNESKSHSTSTSPKPKSKKQSPNKRTRQQQSVDNEQVSTEDDPSLNSAEFTPESVSKLLDNHHLNAPVANTIHDLQCSTGLLVLQAFLEFPRLRRVLGIEANKEFFHLAQQNAVNLTKAGYNGRKFFVVENIPGVKTIIAEASSDEVEASKNFSKGEVVTCLQSLKQNNIDKRPDYRGIVSTVKKGGLLYDITMSATKKTIQNVKKEHIFRQGTERTLEFSRCNLFQRKDGFRSDIVLLPFYISNDQSYRSLLFQALTHSPFNSRILAYEMLEDWDQFETPENRESLKRIDINVYDNDRFESSLSKFYKVYLYKHVISRNNATPIQKLQQPGALKIGNYIRIRDDQAQSWITSKIESIGPKNSTVRVTRYMWEVPFEEEIKVDSQKIHLIEFDHNVGDIVHCYCPKQVIESRDGKWNLYKCGVIAQNPDGTYQVEFEDGERYRKMLSVWMFRPPTFAFREGQMAMALRYDDAKFSENDAKLSEMPQEEYCVVRHHNPDGSYRVEFLQNSFRYHDAFCETWLRPLDDTEMSFVQPVLPLTLEIDYRQVEYWLPNMVSHFINRCGFDKNISNLFKDNKINGPFLLTITYDILTDDLKIPSNIANQIYSYIKSLRYTIGYRNSDDRAIISSINNKISEYKTKLDELKNIEHKAKSNLNDVKNKQKAKDSDNKSMKDYELKIKCIQMSKSGVSKKDISKKLKQPMNWVNKFYKKNVNEIKRPTTSNAEVDSAQENVNRIIAQITEVENKIRSEENRLDMYR